MEGITKSRYFLPIIGLFAGICNGLLGAGGGIIVVYGLNMAFRDVIEDTRDVFANALCVMLPLSALSAVGYALMGKISTEGLSVFILPAIVGGVCGALLLGKIKAATLKKLFAALVIYSGLMLMIK